MPDDYVVDTMGYYMLEAMEIKIGKICDNYDCSCWGGGMKWMTTLTLCLVPLKILDIKIYY